jgi:putative redox protein
VAEALTVTATWQGGYRSLVRARGHEISVDEPQSAAGGDTGMMPTEVFCAALASCFCLALAHVAGKRSVELPGLQVEVHAQRFGRELRYGRFVIAASAAVPEDELASLMGPARRVCWVSNTLAAETSYEYAYTSTGRGEQS